MAEQDTGQERSLEPTAKRLADARREGQIPRSRDLAHLLVLGTAAGVLFAMSGPLLDAGKRVIARGLTFDAAAVADPARMSARLAELSGAALLAVSPVLLILALAAIAAPLSIGGFIFSPQMAAPKFERIDPLKGFGRLFSAPALVELAKVLLVTVLLAVVGFWYVYTHLHEFAGLAHEALPNGLAHFGWMLAAAFALMVATLALTSAIDVPFQIFHHRSKLKMTMEEMKKESKETEGRIRQQQREMARRRMMAAVPKADVVVTNPTHFAVALKYMEGRHRAPVVVAKGADTVAEKIKELAREHGVPQLEAPPLARALHRHVELGDEIPAALYTAVAQVLAYVFQLKTYTAGRGSYPNTPRDIEVPEGM
ncbi:MAG: flagellar type III secretion system protein FlhB, partial [Burkholderiaceae bacterium]|nr:flagellar type III secretion system protein FlhB [Burkholderiaceae bacterium]